MAISFTLLTSKALQKNIAKEFVERMVAWSKNIKVSDPLEEGCRLGPVVSEGQVPHVALFSIEERWHCFFGPGFLLELCCLFSCSFEFVAVCSSYR
jgi:hypothetical protein